MAASETVLRSALDLLTSPTPQKVTTEALKAESLSASEKRRLRTQVRRARAWHLGNNVVSYGIAEKQIGTGGTGDLALTVYVKKKYPKSALDQAQVIPPELALEGLNEAVRTDVREIGELRPEASLTARVRPISGGYSIGHLRGTGTLGCLVTERNGDHGTRLILSNSHVLAAAGTARPGDPIYQPGPDERDAAMEAVATLKSWQPYDFSADYVNRIDAALAEPINQEWFAPMIFDIGIPKGVRAPARGMMVQKSGRTTGHTYGRILDVDNRPALRFPRPDGSGEGDVKFRQQVLCTRYTDGGDSGSLILDAEGYAVGLHVCGGPGASIFSPIQFVLDDLGIDLVT